MVCLCSEADWEFEANGCYLSMIHIALWEPEIPPNTGNIARLCAATGTMLHIIGKPGFRLNDRDLKRAGLDYWHAVTWKQHTTFSNFEQEFPRQMIFAIETVETPIYTQAKYVDGCCLLFGNESRGLPDTIRERYSNQVFGIPMLSKEVRSLNLANSVSIVLYEALRQLSGW